MVHPTRDLRIESFRPLIPPAILQEELPLGQQGSTTVARGREEVSRILNGQDDRLVVIVVRAPSMTRRRPWTTRAG